LHLAPRRAKLREITGRAAMTSIHTLLEPVAMLLELAGVAAILVATLVAGLAVASLAVATGAWLIGPARRPERVLLGLGAIPLLVISPVPVALGAAAIVAGLVVHLATRSGRPRPASA